MVRRRRIEYNGNELFAFRPDIPTSQLSAIVPTPQPQIVGFRRLALLNWRVSQTDVSIDRSLNETSDVVGFIFASHRGGDIASQALD